MSPAPKVLVYKVTSQMPGGRRAGGARSLPDGAGAARLLRHGAVRLRRAAAGDRGEAEGWRPGRGLPEVLQVSCYGPVSQVFKPTILPVNGTKSHINT